MTVIVCPSCSVDCEPIWTDNHYEKKEMVYYGICPTCTRRIRAVQSYPEPCNRVAIGEIMKLEYSQ